MVLLMTEATISAVFNVCLIMFGLAGWATVAVFILIFFVGVLRQTEGEQTAAKGVQHGVTPQQRPPKHLVFSDIDGTIVHYGQGKKQAKSVAEGILKLPASKSGMQGVISQKTLSLARSIQEGGVPYVLVSAVRCSTFYSRLPFLPKANAYIIENGGRIFWNPNAPDSHENLQEDLEWAAVFAEIVPIVEKCRNRLQSEGWFVDCDSYRTMFRVNLKKTPNKKQSDLLQILKDPQYSGLDFAENLGLVDVFPAKSGKKNAAKHIVDKLGLSFQDCAMICDDDNDIPLAEAMGQGAFITQITSASLGWAIEARPAQYTVATAPSGPPATEELLELMRNKLCPFTW